MKTNPNFGAGEQAVKVSKRIPALSTSTMVKIEPLLNHAYRFRSTPLPPTPTPLPLPALALLQLALATRFQSCRSWSMGILMAPMEEMQHHLQKSVSHRKEKQHGTSYIPSLDS